MYVIIHTYAGHSPTSTLCRTEEGARDIAKGYWANDGVKFLTIIRHENEGLVGRVILERKREG